MKTFGNGAFAMDSSAPVVKSPISFIVRCIAEKKGDQWQAFSLEFGLAVQADTAEEVEVKIESMIACYIEDALGQDRRHARELLGRRACLSVRLKYHFYGILMKIWPKKNDRTGIVFDEPLQLAPIAGCAALG